MPLEVDLAVAARREELGGPADVVDAGLEHVPGDAAGLVRRIEPAAAQIVGHVVVPAVVVREEPQPLRNDRIADRVDEPVLVEVAREAVGVQHGSPCAARRCGVEAGEFEPVLGPYAYEFSV